MFILFPGSSANSETSNPHLLSILESALINDTHNLKELQSAFFPAKSTSPSFVSIFIEDCDFIVKKIQQIDGDNPAFSSCDSVCDFNDDEYCFTPQKPASNTLYLSDGSLLLFLYSTNIQKILMTVDYVSFKLFDILTHLELQPFNSDGHNYALLNLTINELEAMPSQDELWDSLELLLSWVSIIGPPNYTSTNCDAVLSYLRSSLLVYYNCMCDIFTVLSAKLAC